MKHYVFFGGSHGIAHASIEKLLEREAQCRVTVFSREAGPWAVHDRVSWKCFDVLSDLPLDLSSVDPESFAGCVYAPGSIQLRPFTSLKLDDFRRDFEINYFSCVRVLQALVPLAKLSKLTPSFVVFSSVAADNGLPMHSSIASAKAALEGLSRSLAAEYAPRMRFNCVAPSLTETPLSESITSKEASRKASEERHPLRRIGNASDIASSVVFLLSEESSWMTGQVLRPDGGLSL